MKTYIISIYTIFLQCPLYCWFEESQELPHVKHVKIVAIIAFRINRKENASYTDEE